MEKFSMLPLPLKDALLINLFGASDQRGSFAKLADADLLSQLHFNANDIFYSTNRKYTLRGMHYLLPFPQARLVFCTCGRIWDAIVDLRRSSPTFKKWHATELSGDKNHGIYVPRGFAHGFLSLEDDSTVFYIADGKYVQESDTGMRFDDPSLAIPWPLGGAKPTVSTRDMSFPFLKDAQLYD